MHARYCSFFFLLLLPSRGFYGSFFLIQKPFAFLSFPSSSFFHHHQPAVPRLKAYSLDLGLGGLEGGGKEVAEVVGGLVEVVAHAVRAEALGDNVEVEAVYTRQLAFVDQSQWKVRVKELTCSR